MVERDLVCKVCGRTFTPHAYSKKVIKTMSGRHYDTFDCPRCGCQVVVQERIVDGQDDLWMHRRSKPVSFPEHKETTKDVFAGITEIIYSDYEEAKAVVHWLNTIHSQYGCVTVADYIDLTRVKDSVPYTAYKYGWEDLSEVSIVRRKGGTFLLHMPPIKKLDVKEYNK